MRFVRKWSDWRLETVRDVAPQIREFTLRPEAGTIDAFAPGSHVEVEVLIDGLPQVRSYSLVGESDGARCRIAVRLAPDSRGGSRAMWALAPGARLKVASPACHFDIDWSMQRFCLLAGGIGITPMVGIATSLRRRRRDVTLHYCVTSRADAAYLDDLAALLGDDLVLHESAAGGRLDVGALVAELPADTALLVCGPLALLEAARHAWAAAGRPPADLRYETFGSSGLLPTVDFRVRIAGSSEEILVPADKSLLEVLNATGHDVISDCERGECGVCAIDVVGVEGEIDHRDVFFSEEQKRGNHKLCPCVSRARGTVILDTLYRRDAA